MCVETVVLSLRSGLRILRHGCQKWYAFSSDVLSSIADLLFDIDSDQLIR